MSERKDMVQPITREQQQFNKAMRMLTEQYKKAKDNKAVRKPLAYALYQVWKYFNMTEKERVDK